MRIRVPAKPTRSTPGADIRRGEPLTFGVPLLRGAAQDGEKWTLGHAGGPGTTAQTHVLDRWPDGSRRWMLVDVRSIST
jgi:hypothetical protein